MLENISFAVGIASVVIIIWGVLLGAGELLEFEFFRISRRATRLNLNEIRHIVASYLLLGLEFLIAADIIRTIAEPSLEDLLILGGLVVIRTVISFFLGREIGRSHPAPHERRGQSTD